ncbi:hypothetical protein DL766_006147 [Monosporascus sp. MC13-8B]|uniref:Uncharacterized protein n=1 Tax=Monosporascus cannonballus TaxID=155416 RepID=A0ABY0HAU9_9PEZI|nr:hypothetical protein DL762_003332 [Monosporascus cannonballus]RYP00542.1 hypothetical protein DL763_000739 [Monosporascus cannonballus]RYP27903.1 hypothetical protein DL766_006147 [Monosporascus sp. MC13-8B]
MINIPQMDPQPDYNDEPKGHYISGLWYEQNHDPRPWNYVMQPYFDHTGWQTLVASFIDAWKNSRSDANMRPMNGKVASDALSYEAIVRDENAYWRRRAGH